MTLMKYIVSSYSPVPDKSFAPSSQAEQLSKLLSPHPTTSTPITSVQHVSQTPISKSIPYSVAASFSRNNSTLYIYYLTSIDIYIIFL